MEAELELSSREREREGLFRSKGTMDVMCYQDSESGLVVWSTGRGCKGPFWRRNIGLRTRRVWAGTVCRGVPAGRSAPVTLPRSLLEGALFLADDELFVCVRTMSDVIHRQTLPE